MFVEYAWIAIKKDPNLMKVYKQIVKTRGAKIAIVGIARRLAGRLRSCVVKGVFYEIKSLKIQDTNIGVEHQVSA